jgi:CheY-like chemotaxis protein
VPASHLRRVFQPFYRGERELTRNTKGTGIGLALVKGLVEMHGGTVAATSPGPGQGATFTVRLPDLEMRAEPALEPPAEERHGSSSSKRRILVADDHADSASSLAVMLRLLGDEVRIARDGLEAVELARELRPQVVLMDIGMPRLNGYDATRRIREQAGGDAVVIIALTGWGQDADRVKSREAGCDGHLVKPVALPELERLLAEMEGSRPAIDDQRRT